MQPRTCWASVKKNEQHCSSHSYLAIRISKSSTESCKCATERKAALQAFYLHVSNIFFSALKLFNYLLYCLLSTGIRLCYFMVLPVSLSTKNDLYFYLEGILTSCSKFLSGSTSHRPLLDFPPHSHSWQQPDWFSLCVLWGISAASCLNLLIKIKLNSTEKYLLT